MYYLRTRAAADAIKFTVDQQVRPSGTAPSLQWQLMQMLTAGPWLTVSCIGSCFSTTPQLLMLQPTARHAGEGRSQRRP